MQVQVVTVYNRLPGMGGRLRAFDVGVRRKGAFRIQAVAAPLTPIDTGALRANVRADETGVTWGQEYAIYQELGTVRGVTPKLFATTAAAQVIPEMIAEYRRIEGSL